MSARHTRIYLEGDMMIKRFAFVAFATSLGCLTAFSNSPTVIFSEISSHPSGAVPGALDGSGNPVATTWNSMFDLAMPEDGSAWMIRGTTTQSSDFSNILVGGAGFTGTAFAQEGQPFQGGSPGELYNFFDGPRPVSWDTNGNLAFSARAKGSSSLEKLIRVSGGTHTQVLQQGDQAFGIVDVPASPSGDELIGNSINSVHLLDSGEVGFINTPVTNLHSTRYPVFFLDSTAVRHTGFTVIDGELWDGMDFDNSGGTPDGQHTFIIGDTDRLDTTMDGILAIDDQVALREGTPVDGPDSPEMAAVFFTRMLNDGTWFARGDDPSNNDWVVRNGTLLTETGRTITGTETWGVAINGFTGNNMGDWIATGSTSNPNPDLDSVMVLNGSEILLREGDAIDLDGNGALDDDVFLRSFTPDDLFLMDNGDVYFLATLRDGTGTNLGDAFLFLEGALEGDFNDDGALDCLDVDSLVGEIVAGTTGTLHDLTGDGLINQADLALWLEIAGNQNIGAPYLDGDANLDGQVDGGDFLIWNANKFTNTAAWCSGDFNADGPTDGADFLIWNANKFMSSDGLGAVPETSPSLILLLLCMSGALRRTTGR